MFYYVPCSAYIRIVFVYEGTAAQTAPSPPVCLRRLRLRLRLYDYDDDARSRPRWIIAFACTDAVSPVHVAPQSSKAPFVFTHTVNVYIVYMPIYNIIYTSCACA